MVRSPDTVDRRRVRTRAALLSAGQSLFAERAVDGVSIDDIVAAADVAKGSFYNHFPDKDALARTLADQARAGVEATVAHVGAGVDDPAERVARALCAFARQAAEFPQGVRMMQRLFHGAAIPDAPMNAGVRADLQAGLTAGRFTGVPLEAAVLMAIGVVQMTVARVLEQQTLAQAADLSRQMAFGLLRGLGLDAARARATADRAAAHIFAPA
ncbi:MAG: TetR/AcrR family transcriptional regulator; helix-turn-helix transcriptional regulator [Alphaproteobacteria bacterium]|nr:TetR/AcrR family transcriptional regulator; helix-turn-helix transcriptional regulator [Alphaproteobacteria bacterium]MBU1516062.1 TetR/AcrR family transcriptional regulator; helix-turn-helix transcriptional regulator [Alphaproteobacteria bacterium]MBU2092723.1 TetR/AcrR family transcriptional regulator; helix-turn-helix transcriptional regulator [Alphaproteobacteria bacterium]MBU2153752.1 TetR/AcrR family transcriptional regulator; helix-turn-helix transcriptional regulator [Alphaproteobacte